MDHKPAAPALYGLMAEFDDPTALVAAARRTYEAGYREFDSFSPYPIHEAVRRDAAARQAGAAVRAARRHRSAGYRVRPAGVGGGRSRTR